MRTTTSLHLYKQNFKFSSAHFLIFDEKSAEMLHGHNYQVRVDIAVPADFDMKESGFFIDFNVLKKEIKALVDAWDEHVLLPANHPDIKTEVKGPSLHLWFRDRYYVFPKNEVILLQVTNTSVEQLADIFGRLLLGKFSSLGVTKLRVKVEETRGQAASIWLEA